jgi:flagellar hook-length control protein FliK
MLASSQTIAPKPAALPPAVQPALPANGSAGGPSFAQLLNDQPTLPAPPAHADAAPREPETHAAAPAPAPAAANAMARRQAAPTQPKPQAPARSGTADAAPPAQPEARAVADDAHKDSGDTSVASTDKADAPETDGLDEFTQLIGMASPLAGAVTPVQPAATAGTPGAATSLAAGTSEATPAQGGAHAAHAANLDREEAAEDGKPTAGSIDPDAAASASTGTERRPAEAPAREPAARAKLAEPGVAATTDKAGPRSTDALQTTFASGPGSAPHAAGTTEGGTPNFAAVLAQALPAPGAAPAAPPLAASGQVHAALHSSAFAPELAASVSLMAVDGVQQAELQLNPADMGPVAVQIVVDGSQAQVSFHAAQADTRQALEQSLPDLAAALQGQGLTLSGGGVFQQSARDADHGQDDRRDSGGRASSGSGTGRIGATAANAAPPVRRSVGLLDTFA